MGRSGDTLRVVSPLIAAMEERGHLTGWLWLVLLQSWAWGCSGRSSEAWAASEMVRARLPDRGFQLHRWYMEFGQVKFLLIERRNEEAWLRVEQVRKQTKFALVGQSQRVAGLWVRANTALAWAAESPPARAELLAEAARLARRMEKERTPWVDAVARTIRAGHASISGDRDRAVRLLAESEPLLEAHQFESVLAAVRLARGRLVGGDTGRALVERAQAWMTEQQAAPAIMRVLLPGWGDA